MSGLYPLSRMQQFDTDGNLLAGAQLFLFTGGTTTPISGYKDGALTTPHTNPILTDSAGRLPLIYLADGFYRQRLTTKVGSLIFDDDGIPVISTGGGGAGTTVDPNGLFKTRDIKIRFDDQPLAGYVRLNGRTIGSAVSGATERANADTQSLYQELWTFANVSVVGGKGGTAAGDFAANKPLTLPDAAGRGLFGMDDLGAGAAGRITGSTITGPTLAGATGGVESLQLSQANIPNYTMSGTATGQTVPISVAGSCSIKFSGVNALAVAVTGATDAQGSHAHALLGSTGAMSSNAVHNHTITGATFAGTTTAGVQGGGTFTGIVTSGVTAMTVSNANIDHTHSLVGNNTDTQGNHAHNVTASGSATSAGAVGGTSAATGFANVLNASVTVGSGGSGAFFTNMPPVLLLMIYIRL